MTKKRDLKRRVRERQAQTGESYVTARRHVTAAVEKPTNTIPIVELVDVSGEAAQRGLRCSVMITPELVDRVAAPAVIDRLHAVLAATPDDPATALLRDVALAGVTPKRVPKLRDFEALRRFFQRARAGLGGTSDNGMHLAFPIAAAGGLVSVLCTLWGNRGAAGPALVLATVGEELGELWDVSRLQQPFGPTLFVVLGSRRHTIRDDEFVIGRQTSADLQIRDGAISRRHAAVIRRNSSFYIKDLGSHAGIVYKGMRIDNKRIDEGDVFELAGYQLRFTFLVD